MMKTTLITLAASAFLLSCGTPKEQPATVQNETLTLYKPEWSSLARHQSPQWLLDMKFGIYCHWGPQSVLSTSGEIKDNVTAANAKEIYAKWTGEKFNASEWVALFEEAGAQFAGPVAIHGTGCVNWDSKVTSWNSTNYGPKVDILGELAREVKKRDMKLIATFHNVQPKGIWGERSLSDRTFVEPTDDISTARTEQSWMEGWYDRIYEAVSKYDVDLAWFDTSFGNTVRGELDGFFVDGHYTYRKDAKKNSVGGISERYQRRLFADYLNDASSKGREVEILYKTHDIPANVGMRDIENGNLNGLQYDPWIADINMMHHVNSWTWFYTEQNPLKDANCLVDMLIDMTSKNGRLLLNVPPLADGSFPPRIVKELKGIGSWLKVNSEGIYGTTPWSIYGEGPTKIKHPGHHGQGKMQGKEMAAFTAQDLRYTTKGNAVYAFVLDTPSDGKVLFRGLGSANKIYPDEVLSVELLGSDKAVEWQHLPEGLSVKLPQGSLPTPYAHCFKVSIKE